MEHKTFKKFWCQLVIDYAGVSCVTGESNALVYCKKADNASMMRRIKTFFVNDLMAIWMK